MGPLRAWTTPGPAKRTPHYTECQRTFFACEMKTAPGHFGPAMALAPIFPAAPALAGHDAVSGAQELLRLLLKPLGLGRTAALLFRLHFRTRGETYISSKTDRSYPKTQPSYWFLTGLTSWREITPTSVGGGIWDRSSTSSTWRQETWNLKISPRAPPSNA